VVNQIVVVDTGYAVAVCVVGEVRVALVDDAVGADVAGDVALI
jgi:hypothetical protein